MDAVGWDATVFSKTRDRLIEAWASMKSFWPREDADEDGDPPAREPNAEHSFKGQRRSNGSHASSSDPELKPYRKGNGQGSRLCFMGHLLMENRNALIVDTALTQATSLRRCLVALTSNDK